MSWPLPWDVGVMTCEPDAETMLLRAARGLEPAVVASGVVAVLSGLQWAKRYIGEIA